MDHFRNELIDIIRSLKFDIQDEQIQIIDRGIPHNIPKQSGHMIVYTFVYHGRYLKIGKAGPKSFARVNSQHYNPDSSDSNLSKSILSDPDFQSYSLTKDAIKDWIKSNTTRIDIQIDSQLGISVLNFIEAYLHLKLQPKYEGYKNQRF